MQGLKKSLSFQGQWKAASEDHRAVGKEDQRAGIHLMSSYDTLVIQGRTRYPSDQKQIPMPLATDLQIAAALLGRSDSAGSGLSDVRHHKSLFEKSEFFAGRYNRAAKEHGLSEIDASPAKSPQIKCVDENIKRNTWRWFHHRLSRKSSLIHLPASHSPSGPRWQSLDDMYRLGGMSIIHLGQEYAPLPLAIPTCLAATANYLIQHGRDAPGIFRIPGSATVVNALYEYYVSRMDCDHEATEKVQITVGCGDLPDTIGANAHDVASAFKRFLWDLPGGIIGSTALFKTLKEIEHTPAKYHQAGTDERFLRPRLVALALLSLPSRRRFALICAVFGLLAFLKQDDVSEASPTSSYHWGSESMSSRALGVVFAPVLLGNMTEHIEVGASPTTSKRGLLPQRKTQKRSTKTECSPEIQASLGRTSSAADIIDFLLVNWGSIIKQVHGSRTQPNSASTSRLCSITKCVSQPAMGLHDRDARNAAVPFVVPVKSDFTAGVTLQAPQLENSAGVFNDSKYLDSDTSAGFIGSSDFDSARMPLLHGNIEDAFLRQSETSETNPAWWERASKANSERSVIIKKDASAALSHMSHTTNVTLEVSDTRTTSESTQVDTRIERNIQDFSELSNPFSEGSEDKADEIRYHAEIIGQSNIAIGPSAYVQTQRSHSSGSSAKKKRSQGRLDHLPSMRLNSTEHGSMLSGIVSYGFSPGRPQRNSPSLIPRPVGHLGNGSSENGFGRHSRSMLNDVSNAQPSRTSASRSGFSTQDAKRAGSPGTTAHGGRNEARRYVSSQRGSVQALSLIPEPATARHLYFKSPSDERGRYGSEDSTEINLQNSRSANVGTLFAEIRRLKMNLDMRHDEITHLRHELDAMRRFKDAGTLSEKLRETERELRFWRHRAQWAEKSLFGKGGSDAV